MKINLSQERTLNLSMPTYLLKYYVSVIRTMKYDAISCTILYSKRKRNILTKAISKKVTTKGINSEKHCSCNSNSR